MSEYFDVVDENDNIIGKASRDECHKKGLLHRSVHILITNSKGEMLLQKRSMKKDLYAGWWIDAAAGHVDAGERYEQAAKREVKEELGIEIEFEELFRTKRKWTGDGRIDNELIAVYLGRSDGPFDVPKDEVEFVKFFSFHQIAEMMKTEDFTPGTVTIFEEIRKNPALLKRLGLS